MSTEMIFYNTNRFLSHKLLNFVCNNNSKINNTKTQSKTMVAIATKSITQITITTQSTTLITTTIENHTDAK